LDMNIFMSPPMMARQGSIDDMARAKRQDQA